MAESPEIEMIHTTLKTLLKVARDNRGVKAAVGGEANAELARKHLKSLEDTFGCEIRQSGSNPSVLTVEGLELASLTQAYLSSLEEFYRKCQRHPREIRIGAGESISTWIVAPALNELVKDQSVFSLRAGGMEGLILSLKGGLIDFAIVPEGAPLDKNWKSESIGVYDYGICCSKDLLATEKLDENILPNLSFALMKDHWGLDFIGNAAKSGFKLNVKFICEQFAQVEGLLRTGSVAGIVPTSTFSSFSNQPFRYSKPLFLRNCDRTIKLVWKETGVYTREDVKELAPAFLERLKMALKAAQNVPDIDR